MVCSKYALFWFRNLWFCLSWRPSHGHWISDSNCWEPGNPKPVVIPEITPNPNSIFVAWDPDLMWELFVWLLMWCSANQEHLCLSCSLPLPSGEFPLDLVPPLRKVNQDRMTVWTLCWSWFWWFTSEEGFWNFLFSRPWTCVELIWLLLSLLLGTDWKYPAWSYWALFLSSPLVSCWQVIFLSYDIFSI